jgi:hypothetical protein
MRKHLLPKIELLELRICSIACVLQILLETMAPESCFLFYLFWYSSKFDDDTSVPGGREDDQKLTTKLVPTDKVKFRKYTLSVVAKKKKCY